MPVACTGLRNCSGCAIHPHNQLPTVSSKRTTADSRRVRRHLLPRLRGTSPDRLGFGFRALGNVVGTLWHPAFMFSHVPHEAVLRRGLSGPLLLS